jgi:repressor LexA
MSEDNEVKKLFATNILRLRKEKCLTQQELCDRLSVSKTTISEWESAKKLPNAGSIEKITSFFNVPKSTLFAEGNERFLTFERMLKLPIVGKISCGNGLFAYEEIEDYESTPEDWIRGGEYFYLRAEGDSMINARIFNGDLVLIRRQSEVENGEIAAVLINDKIYLKRVYKRENSISLYSENPKYPPQIFEVNDDIHVIGKLKKIIINV